MSNPIALSKSQIISGIIYWAVISLVYSVVLTAVLKIFNLTTIQVVADAAINNLLITISSILIFNNMRFYLPRQEKYWYVIAISIGLSSVCLFAGRGILWLIFKSDAHYIQSLSQTSAIRFGISFLLIGCICMMSLLWYTQKENLATSERKADAERLSKEAELSKLRQQLQPHFLFNSLNSISALTGRQPEKARHMIQQLSDFLRGTLKADDKQANTLEKEMEYLELYLDIEKVRFGHRLQTEIFYTDDVLQMQLPALLLQPIMENAIKFGLYDTTGDVLITLKAYNEKGYLKIIITNPFDVQTSQPLKGTGFGLSSVNRRLFLIFSRQGLLQTEKNNDQFITTILIPQAA